MKLSTKVLLTVFLLLTWMPATFSAETQPVISASEEWVNPDVSSSYETDPALRSMKSVQTATNLQELQTKVHNGLLNYERNFFIQYQGNTANLKAELSSIIETIFKEDEYLSGTIAKWGFSYNGYVNDVTITFMVDYLTTHEQEQYVDSEVTRILEEIIQPGMTEFQKVKAVNDYIVLHTSYSFNTKASPHSVYAILNEGKGVCQAYALLTYKMLERLDIGVHYVTGEAGGIGHAWNLVRVDGKWYNLDTTWNDPLPNRKGQVYYSYFLVTDTQLRKDHTWEQGVFPTAMSSDYAFMHNMTSATTLDQVVYYSNAADQYKLYSFNLVTKQQKKLTNNLAQYVAAFGGKIYFSNYSNGAYLTEINTNGTGEKALNQSKSTDLYIESPYLYFKNGQGTLEKIQISNSITFDPTQYTVWSEKETSLPTKAWRIQLNAPVQKTSVHNQSVYIVDEAGQKVTFVSPVVENNQYIIMKNDGNFTRNTKYYVVIENSLLSTSGKALSKGVVMPFSVK